MGTRLTHGAWPALPLFTEHVTARGFGTHLDIGGGPTHRPRLSLATPLARSDARGRGGADAQTHTHARTPAHSFTHRRQHHSTVLDFRARLGTRGSILCYSQLWDGGLLQPDTVANGSTPKPRVRVTSQVLDS